MTSRTRLSLGLLFACAACAAPDPIATSAGEGRSARADDGLLDTPELQQVVDVALRRDSGALRAFLSDPDTRVRARAALAFATVRDRSALVDLRALLQDDDPQVRADAAFALAHYPGAGEAGDQMLDRLEVETDRDVRAALIDALGKAGLSRSLGALLDLDGPDRANATLALSRAVIRGAAPGGAVDSLVARMRDPDPVVRRNAAYFMERVDDVLVWIDHRRSIRGALDNMAVDDPAAMSIIDGLARRFDVFSLPRIVYRAHNATDWRVRANAMAALRDMGLGASRLGALLAGLDDPSPHVQAQAAASLATSPPDDDVRAWMIDWVDRRPRSLMALGPILGLLAQVGEEDLVLGWIDDLAADDERAWTAVAIPALEELPGEEAIEALLAIAGSSDPRVARPAASALEERLAASLRVTSPATVVEVLERAVREADARVVAGLARQMADSSFVATGGRERLASLAAEVDGRRRYAAVRALADVGALDLLPEPLRDLPEVEADDASSATASGAPARVDWGALNALGSRPRWVIDTDRGRVVVALAADQAPLTVQRLSDLAAAGRFSGVPFHRVVPNFVVQGGDLSRGLEAGPPAGPLSSEITRIPFERGVIGMANTGSLDTESSQFFITHDRQPHLDGGYTAFGWVVEGMDVLDRIELGDRIRAIQLVRDPR